MTRYVALLRGINVGAQHRVNMAELKQTFMEAGFEKIETYIQSGNVVFSAEGGEDALRKHLEEIIGKRFGFPVPAVLRTAEELASILENCPFSPEEVRAAEEASGAESLHAAMMLAPLSREAEAALAAVPGGDRFAARGKEVYFLLENGVHASKLVAKFLKMEAHNTLRNWKTVRALAQLAAETEEKGPRKSFSIEKGVSHKS